jgi:hypothetical protein
MTQGLVVHSVPADGTLSVTKREQMSIGKNGLHQIASNERGRRVFTSQGSLVRVQYRPPIKSMIYDKLAQWLFGTFVPNR